VARRAGPAARAAARLVAPLVLVGCAAHGGGRRAQFYAGRPYGTEAQFNPLSEVVNEGFDMLRTDFADRHVLRFPYDIAAGNVGRSLLRPDAAYRRFGWGRALRGELLPLSTRRNGGGQWFPNYQFHLVGSGMVSARMTEWYAWHGAPHPELMSGVTMAAAHVLNEMIENGSSRAPNEDAVTDLYVFDLGGVLLFRSLAVRRFFSEKVQLTNWPLQPSFDFGRRTLENAGQQFVLRAPLPGTKSVRAFYAFGVSGIGGLSFGRAGGTSLSVGFGAEAVDTPVVDTTTGARTAVLRPNAGLFLDRGGSLLVSVTRTGSSDASLAVNVYPGVVRLGHFSPGLWAQALRGGGVRAGLVGPLGIGVARGPR
jgi:hypothetical protein